MEGVQELVARAEQVTSAEFVRTPLPSLVFPERPCSGVMHACLAARLLTGLVMRTFSVCREQHACMQRDGIHESS